MTENLNQTETNTPISSNDAPERALTTREILEQNWDRFMNTDEAETASAPQSNLSAENEPSTPEIPPFDANSHLDTAYEELKSQLQEKGVTSKEEWIKSLVYLDKLYHQDFDKFLATVHQDQAKNKIKSTCYDIDRLKEAVIQKGLMALMGQNRGGMTQPFIPQMGQGQMPIQNPSVNPSYLMQKMPQMPQIPYHPLDAFKIQQPKADMTSLLKDLVQQELTSFIAKNQETSQKAKSASFTPKATQTPPKGTSTHTASGRLKTTREILEEGCRLLGI